MGYTFRTAGPWGIGTSEDLTPEQVDNNFWQAIQDNEAKATQGVGIANIVVHGNQFYVVLTDHTLMGPFDLPMATIQFKGEWQPNTQYFAGDIITHGGSTYMVEVNHVSAASFDPGANDGMGNDYYGLLLQNAGQSIPSGGAVGMVLTKATTADYSTRWLFPTLRNLHDVLASPAPTDGDLVSWSTGAGAFTYVSQATVLSEATFAGLADVSVTSPVAGEPLIYDGTKYINTKSVDMPFASVQSGGPTATIDRAAGEVQDFAMWWTPSCALTITGWPPSGQFGRLVLRVNTTVSPGLIVWPINVKWPGGVAPTNTQPGIDVYIFVTFDGGVTVYGNVVGQNYS